MTPLDYRKAVVENASPIGLVIALYDTLVADIQRAIEATKAGDIEKRTSQIVHAFQVLQQLEGGLNMSDGSQTAKDLSRLYRHIRAKLLEAQFKQSVDMLTAQIDLALQMRQAWQRADAVLDENRASESPVEGPSVPVYGGNSKDCPVSRWTV